MYDCNGVDGSGSTTSEPCAGGRVAPGRTASLRKEGRQRWARLLTKAVIWATIGGLILLEAGGVMTLVRERYDREVTGFIDYCGRPPDLVTKLAAQVDGALPQYFNYRFLPSPEAAEGEQALARLVSIRPEFGPWDLLGLPNAWQVLRRWRERAPTGGLRAWAFGVWAALAWTLDATLVLLMGAFLLLSRTTCCRPEKLRGLRRRRVRTLPQAFGEQSIPVIPDVRIKTSKTGFTDVCVALDSE